MIEENALVVQNIPDDKRFVWVQTQRKTACGSCSAKAGCGTQLLARLFGQKLSRVKVLNPCHAKPGDHVIIALEDDAVLKGSFMLYFVPLMSLILFSLLGTTLAKNFSLSTAMIDLSSIVAAGIGLVLGIYSVRIYTFLSAKQLAYEAKIIKILPQFHIQ